MSSPFRSDAGLAVAMLAMLLAGGCERERREYHASPTRAPSQAPRLTSFQPGVPMEDPVDPIGKEYEGNSYHVSQGSQLYRAYNCNGCHAMGGGAMGPALMDDEWRYGGRIDQIHDTIMQGRPNGMPSWRGKLTDQQVWQLAAFVRSLSGNVRKDVASSRTETLSGPPALTQMPDQPPKGGDSAGVQAPPP